MASCIAHVTVTEGHLILVERTLAYLTVDIVWGKSVRCSCGRRKRGGYTLEWGWIECNKCNNCLHVRVVKRAHVSHAFDQVLAEWK